MSSLAVRTAIKDYITNNTSEKLADMDGDFQELQDFLANNTPPISMTESWVGIEFIGNDETPITVPAHRGQGRFRENGAVYIHVVDVAKLAVHGSILTRAEALRDLLRGQRLGSVTILSVTPPNFSEGATLSFEGGFISASFIVEYEYDKEL